MYSEVAWVLISSETQGQPQMIFEAGYLLMTMILSVQLSFTFVLKRRSQKAV